MLSGLYLVLRLGQVLHGLLWVPTAAPCVLAPCSVALAAA